MPNVINASLARHLRQILNLGLARDNAIAAVHGWQARQVKPGTWSYRDPRFIYRKYALTQPSSGCSFCDDKIAEWFDDPELIPRDRKVKAKRWS
jgi:hypothetical protein